MVCDCKIYPKYGSIIEVRNYWRYTRLENGQWRKEYYDNEGNIIDQYLIQDIMPYEFIETKTGFNKGYRPSVKIYKYFKTKRLE